MFKTVVVALDLDADGDRVLPYVHALARSGSARVDLVTVSEPGMSSAVDAYELERRATANGWGSDAWTVVHDVDAAGGLVTHAARREQALLVMATSARRPLTSSLLGSVGHDVLRRTDRPVLMVGPNVAPDYAPPSTTLVPFLDSLDAADRAIPAIIDWQTTFTCEAPQIVEVVAPGVDGTAARRVVDHIAARLAAQHIHGTAHVVFDDDPITALEAVSAPFEGAVYVATSARYTDGRLHWYSTTQRLVQHATCPVLVVPARPAPIPTAEAAIDEHSPFRDLTVAAGSSAV